MRIIEEFRYRPEVDGLRAIAVIAVVLFHADLGVTGGFIGVDVFFVISGYLITSLILKELGNGSFSLTNFWERRARRILPAVTVVVLVCLVTGWFVLLPQDFDELGRATVWQSLFGANFYYWLSTDYFAGPSEEAALLHTWSLAVEEQFYVLFPLVLVLVAKLSGAKRPQIFITSFVLLFIASLALSVYAVPRMPVASFYLLPTRAWELLSGSLVAIVPVHVLQRKKALCEILSWVSMLCIIIPCFVYTKNTPFPGIAAIPPCLGTAIFIWSSNQSGDSNHQLSANWLISKRGIVFIGLISYSLYLWHWPLFAFSHYWVLGTLSPAYRICLIILAVLLSVLSWKYVETPFRKRQLGATRKSVFLYASSGLVSMLLLGWFCIHSAGFPSRLPAQALQYASAKNDFAYYVELTKADIESQNFIQLGITANESIKPSVMIWGDSHAMAFIPALKEFLEENDLSGIAATRSSTAPVVDWVKISGRYPVRDESRDYNQAVFDHIKANKIENVILVARWRAYAPISLGGENESDEAYGFERELIATIRQLSELGVQTWLILDVPNHAFDVPRGLSHSVFTGEKISELCETPDTWVDLVKMYPSIIEDIKEAGGKVIDPKPWFLSPEGRYYRVNIESVVLYKDGDHLTTKGSELIMVPFLKEKLLIQKYNDK